MSPPAGAFDLDGFKSELNDLTSPSSRPAGSGLSQFSTQDQIKSLKQALTQGAETAVKDLARKDGFLGNAKVRIPLPDSLQKADRAMRRLGMGKYPDELITAMNRAAESAVPEARKLFVGAVEKMTVSDAKAILTGNDDAATLYFRKNTETALAGKFKPIVVKAMRKVKLAETYDEFAGKGAKFGLVDQRDANLEDYITRKAMDGLFLMMAEQEKAIREDPLKATGNLAKQVFSALQH
ncbi:MAG TPA: DUF4197 domain-containing protein [Gallionella sp.]|nr:DUF4197 domain-containing protein [Gallionella sp.]